MAGQLEYFVTDDPERAWAMIKDHAEYRWNSYNRYMFEGTSRASAPPTIGDKDAVGGRVEIGTAEQIATAVRTRTAGLPVTDMRGWSDYPGLPDALVDRHLELTFTKLAPLLR
jgi:hypothetical protein